MRRSFLLLAGMAFAVLFASGVAGALTSGAVLDANAPNNDAYSDTASIPPSDQRIVQTFVAQNTGYLTDIKVRVGLSTQYSGEIIAQIISIPTPNGSTEVLSETRVSALARDYKPQMMSATFDSPAYVVAGQTYGLALDTLPEQGGGWVLSSAGYPDGKLRGLQGNSTWTDFSGSIDGVFSIYVVPDTTGPAVTIDSAPEKTTRAGASFTFSSPESDATFECSLRREADNYSSGWQECGANGAGNIGYSNLAPGYWIFTVRAYDAVGNVTEATHKFVVEDPPGYPAPVTTITGGPSEGETVNTNTVTFAFSANEPGVTFECFLGVAGTAGPEWGGVRECNSGQTTYSGLADSAQNYDGEPNDGKVGGDYVFIVRATDADGNVVAWNDATTRRFRVDTSDTTPPRLRLPADITQKATSASGAGVTFTTTATDDNPSSPQVSCSRNSGDTFPLGSTTVDCSAVDAAGNTSTGSFNVSVLYGYTGFFSPVDNPEVLNKAKAGSSIPVKFSLSGNMGLGIFAKAADGSSYPKSGAMACDSTDPVDAIEQTVNASSSGLTYDAATDSYTYVWKTNKDWTGCRQLVVKLNDGKDYRANFKFVK